MEECRGEACEDDVYFADGFIPTGDNNMSPSCPTTFLGLIAAPIVHTKDNKTEFIEADKENYPPCKVSYLFVNTFSLILINLFISYNWCGQTAGDIFQRKM